MTRTLVLLVVTAQCADLATSHLAVASQDVYRTSPTGRATRDNA